jgi:hypothetical protein
LGVCTVPRDPFREPYHFYSFNILFLIKIF